MTQVRNTHQVRVVQLKPDNIEHARAFALAEINAARLGQNMNTMQIRERGNNHLRLAYMLDIPGHDVHRIEPERRPPYTPGVLTNIGNLFKR
jgi:hypothetical protein